MKKTLISFIPFAVVIFLTFGGIYGAVQQGMRMSANDLPMQLARDAAVALKAGAEPASLTRNQAIIDLAQTSSPFIIVTDDTGTVLESSAQIYGSAITLPIGILDKARNDGENKVTWQPQGDVREALVIERVTGHFTGFVIAGQSLREVENHAQTLFFDLCVGGIFTLIATFLALFFTKKYLN